jgi:hypothetical protein
MRPTADPVANYDRVQRTRSRESGLRRRPKKLATIASDPYVLATWVNQIDGYQRVPNSQLDPSELVSGVKEIAGFFRAVQLTAFFTCQASWQGPDVRAGRWR